MSTESCQRMVTELVAFLDGELGSDERRPVNEHLATCLDCRREMERLKSVHGWLRDLPPIEPSASFAADFARRLAAEPTPIGRRAGGSRGWRWAIPVLAAAAGLVLAFRALTPTAIRPATPAAPPAERVAAVPEPGAPATGAPAQLATRPTTADASPQHLANVEALRPEDLPPELLEHPELFLRLPVVRRLDTLEYLGSLHDRGDDGAG